MWYLFQLAVMLAVGWVGVYFDWQHAGGYDHGIAPAALAVFAAYVATKIISVAISRRGSKVSRQ